MSLAVYPGSFDPITHGHIDVIRRGIKVFDKVIVAVADNPTKKSLFSQEERVDLIRKTTSGIRALEVECFDGLVVDYTRRKKASVILRGIRTISDFEYEYQMALTNRTFAPEIETVFVTAHEEFSFVSSRLIKEAAAMGGDVGKFVPAEVEQALRRKLGRGPQEDRA